MPPYVRIVTSSYETLFGASNTQSWLKKSAAFSVKVLDEHVPIALDILSDLVLHPVFDAEDIARERGVILEEIKMDEDNPDYLVNEIFTQNFWKDHPLCKPILGTKETFKRFERQAVLDAY